jgi:hypothetical protein
MNVVVTGDVLMNDNALQLVLNEQHSSAFP